MSALPPTPYARLVPSVSIQCLCSRGLADGNTWLAYLSFLYIDFMDCTGTLFAM